MNRWPEDIAASIASRSDCVYTGEPQLLLDRRIPLSMAYWRHEMAPDVGPDPFAPRNFNATILHCQFTPATPTPLFVTAPIVPDTCVPWP